MKKVFSNSEIMHIFNLQEQINGRTSNFNIYFEYNKIYSYGSHYLLGEILKNGNIIINNKGYSNTTSKHISLLTSATRNRKQYFTEQIKTQAVLNTLKEYINKLPRATKNKDYYKNAIISNYNTYIKYCRDFKLLTSKRRNQAHREILSLYKKFSSNQK